MAVTAPGGGPRHYLAVIGQDPTWRLVDDCDVTMQSVLSPAETGRHTPPNPPARVGAELRAARERLGWSLPDTSAYLRIRPRQLEALEAGNAAELPDQVYVLGFVRCYAKAVGLDGEALGKRYLAEVGGPPKAPELNFPVPTPRHRVPPGAIVLLGAVLAVVGYGGWLRVNGDKPDSVTVQQVPARLAPLALPVVPPPPKHMALATPPAAAPSKTASVTTLPSVSPSAAEASVPPPGSLNPVDPPQTVDAGHAAPNQLVLTATADAWVQVKDGQGHIVLSKLMHKGDSWVVPSDAGDASPLTLTTGNAGGTQISLDGQALPSLGADGVVRRNVKLDAVDLRAGATEPKPAGQIAQSGQG